MFIWENKKRVKQESDVVKIDMSYLTVGACKSIITVASVSIDTIYTGSIIETGIWITFIYIDLTVSSFISWGGSCGYME